MERAMTATRELQPDLFGTTVTPSTSALGLLVVLPHACPCGSTTGAIGSSCGPHAAKAVCAQCGKFLRWLPATALAGINEQIDHIGGRPAAPIVLHRRQGD
jgi:hypothetical protein